MTEKSPVTIPTSFQDKISNVKTTKKKSSDDTKSRKSRSKIRHICEICNREFTKKCGLSNHLLIHAGVKPFTCDICKKSFTKKCTLTVHLLTHSSERPHVCDVCKKSFARKTDLQKHKFVHTGEKRHVCDICNSKFTHQNNLRRHKMKHFPKDDKKRGKSVLGLNPNLSKVLKDTANVKNISDVLKQAIVKKINKGSDASVNTKSHTNGTAFLGNTNNIKETFIMKNKQTNISKPETISKSDLIFNANQSNLNNTARINNFMPVDSFKLKNIEMFNTDQRSGSTKHEAIPKSLKFKEPIYNIKSQNTLSDLKSTVNLNAVAPINSFNLNKFNERFINTSQQNNANKPETVFKLLNIVEPICIVGNINQRNMVSQPINATNINTFIPINSFNMSVNQILLNQGQHQMNSNNPGTILKLLNIANPICTVNGSSKTNIVTSVTNFNTIVPINSLNIKEISSNKQQESNSNKPEAALKLSNVVEPICNVNNMNKKSITNNIESINAVPIDSMNAKEKLVDKEKLSNFKSPESILTMFNIAEPDGNILNKSQQYKTNSFNTSTKINNVSSKSVNTNNVNELFINKDQEGNLNKSETVFKLLNNVEPISNASDGNSLINNSNKTANISTDTCETMSIKNDTEEQSMLNESKADFKSSNITKTICSVSKDNPQIPTTDLKNTANENCITNLKVENDSVTNSNESDDVKKVREIKDIFNSLPAVVTNKSKIHTDQSNTENKKVKLKTRKSLPNADSFPEPMAMESQILMELEKLKKARESLKRFSKRHKSFVSGSESLEKTIQKKDLCQSLSVDNDLEQALAFASDVIKIPENSKSLPVNKNNPNITLEDDMQILDIPLNETNNTINSVQVLPPGDKKFQNSTIDYEDQNSLAKDRQVLNIPTNVVKHSINYDEFLIPKIEDAQNISRELKIVDDIVKEYETSKKSIPDNAIDAELLSTIHNDVQCIASEMQVLEHNSNNIQVIDTSSTTVNKSFQVIDTPPTTVNKSFQIIDTPSTTVNNTFMDIQPHLSCVDNKESEIQTDSSDEIQILSSTFDNAENDLFNSQKPFTCDICSNTFHSQKEFLVHVSSSHISEDQTSCYLCDLELGDNGRLREHILTHYEDDEEEEEDDDISLDDDFCKIGPLSPGDISLQDIDSINFTENFEEDVARMYALAHIDMELDGNDSDTDDEATILYSYSQTEYLSDDEDLAQDQPSEIHTLLTKDAVNKNNQTLPIKCAEQSVTQKSKDTCIDFSKFKIGTQTKDPPTVTDKSEASVTQKAKDTRVTNKSKPSITQEAKDTCFDFSKFKVITQTQDPPTITDKSEPSITQKAKDTCFDLSKFMTQMQVTPIITDKPTSEVYSKETDTNLELIKISPLDMKNIIGCSSVHTKCTEDNDLNAISIDDINVKDFETVINHELLMMENKVDNINPIDICNNVCSEKDILSQINIAENLSQFETTPEDELLLVENKDKNMNQFEINNDVLSKLNMAKSMEQIVNATNDKLLLKTINQIEIANNILKEENALCNVSISRENVVFLNNNTQPNNFLSQINKNVVATDNSIQPDFSPPQMTENENLVSMCNKIQLQITDLDNKNEDTSEVTMDNNQPNSFQLQITKSQVSMDSNIQPNCIQPQITDLDINKNEDTSEVTMNNNQPNSLQITKNQVPIDNNIQPNSIQPQITDLDINKNEDSSEVTIDNNQPTSFQLQITKNQVKMDNIQPNSIQPQINDLNINTNEDTSEESMDNSIQPNSLQITDLDINKNEDSSDSSIMDDTFDNDKPPFICDFCDKTFTRKMYLHAHYLMHAGIKQYTCKDCNKKFGKKCALATHSLVHTRERNHSCNECGKTFSRKTDFQMHAIIHTGQKPFSCDLCKKSFNSKNNLRRHKRSMENRKKFICYICNSRFAERLGLLSHVKIHIKQAEMKSTSGKLSENIRNGLMSMKEKFYECDVCNMLFARRDRLMRHKLTHAARDTHLCEFCGCTFKTKEQLKVHLSNHTENEFKDIEFGLGNLGDVDLASLEPTIQTTKKTYTCDKCLKVYTKSSALKCHYLTHTGGRPHKCHLCKKAFAQRTNLKRHILSHSGIKPFMCNICHKHFARKPYLRKHYLSHTSEELFTLLGNLPDV